MSDEETNQPILDVDAQKVAMAVGHVAALALVTQMRDGAQSELELYYRLFEPLETGRQTEDDLAILAQYVCDRPENVTGEQLFRKAAELALHKADPDSYFKQSLDVREAYRLFAKSCRLVFIDLEIWQREEKSKQAKAAQKRKPIPHDDQTFAPDDKPLDKDQVRDAAFKAIASMPETKGPIAPEQPEAKEPAPDPMFDDETPFFSIGERPVAHQGKPQRGGARTSK